jgi:Family of unknown function (DUF5336)
MSYPQGPTGGPGYPPAQQQSAQFSAPTQQFNKVPETEQPGNGASKLPLYLAAAVTVLGFLVYLSNFAPQFTVSASDFGGLGELSGTTPGVLFAVIAAVLAGLLAGVSLLPRQRSYTAIAAVLAVLGFLLVIAEVVNKPSGTAIGWGLYLVIAFTLLQAAVAVVVLLFDSGIIAPPVPRPKYDQQQQYGQYPGGYYGQQSGQPQHGGPGQHQQGPQQQRPGYPSQYGGGYPSTGPSTGGFPSVPQSGPPTPPTGYPTYGQPPASNTPTTQVPSQHQSPSSQSGQSSS